MTFLYFSLSLLSSYTVKIQQMDTLTNTPDKVKIWVSIAELRKLRAALPLGSIGRIAAENNVISQMVTYAFTKVCLKNLHVDGKRILVERDMIASAINILKETGNASFDYLLHLEPQTNEA